MKRYFRKIISWWLAVAAVIGRVNTFVLLVLLYLLVVTPIGVLLRVFKASPLARPESSRWTKKSGEENLERQF